jgi:hypothetical protein
MRTIRNGALLILVASVVLTRQSLVFADWPPPTFYDCPDGCTCSPDYDNWNHVVAECPEVAGADVCSYALSACSQYCSTTLPTWWGVWTSEWPSCWLNDFDCENSLEPPGNWTCDCLCWH